MEVLTMEMMIWNVVITGLLGVLAYLMREKFDELGRISILINRTREEVARDHMTRQEFRADMQQLLDRFDRLEQKIDRLSLEKVSK